jgi:hypothetical protein
MTNIPVEYYTELKRISYGVSEIDNIHAKVTKIDEKMKLLLESNAAIEKQMHSIQTDLWNISLNIEANSGNYFIKLMLFSILLCLFEIIYLIGLTNDLIK